MCCRLRVETPNTQPITQKPSSETPNASRSPSKLRLLDADDVVILGHSGKMTIQERESKSVNRRAEDSESRGFGESGIRRVGESESRGIGEPRNRRAEDLFLRLPDSLTLRPLYTTKHRIVIPTERSEWRHEAKPTDAVNLAV